MRGDIGTVLVIVLVISVVALFVQLLYILCRRRVFRRRINTDQFSIYDFYFFCIKHNSRGEPNSITTGTNSSDDRNSNRRSSLEVVDVDLLKLQGIFAPPGFLFTIKEEDREDLESVPDRSRFGSDKEDDKISDGNRNRKMSLEECFTAAGVVAVDIDDDDGGGRDTTPFSTPCESPVYFTPSISPAHEVVNC